MDTPSTLVEQCKELEKVFINVREKYFQVDKGLLILEKVLLLLFLVNNIDIFA